MPECIFTPAKWATCGNMCWVCVCLCCQGVTMATYNAIYNCIPYFSDLPSSLSPLPLSFPLSPSLSLFSSFPSLPLPSLSPTLSPPPLRQVNKGEHRVGEDEDDRQEAVQSGPSPVLPETGDPGQVSSDSPLFFPLSLQGIFWNFSPFKKRLPHLKYLGSVS